MKSFFEQPWPYAVIAFVLGLIIGYAARGLRKDSQPQPTHAEPAAPVQSDLSEEDGADTATPPMGLLSPAASQAAAKAAQGDNESSAPAVSQLDATPAEPTAESVTESTTESTTAPAEPEADEVPADETPTGQIPTPGMVAAQSAPEPQPKPESEGATAAEPDASPVAVMDAWKPGPYPNSALPADGGAAPAEEFTIKAKADSKLFHTDASPYYRRVKPDVWFRTEADAVAAGFTGWVRRPKTATQ